jgi:hypothetical protein
MSKNQLAVLDSGEANRRILAKDEYRADFRRVEAASLKRRTRLASADGKRIFARCFYSFQASVYFVSALGRTKLPHEYVEQIEQAVRNKLEEGTKEINQAIDGAELLFKNHSIEIAATYDTVALEVEVGITSALGRRYFELIHKLDQLMPLLQTLEIEEVLTEKQVEQQRSRFKRIVCDGLPAPDERDGRKEGRARRDEDQNGRPGHCEFGERSFGRRSDRRVARTRCDGPARGT